MNLGCSQNGVSSEEEDGSKIVDTIIYSEIFDNYVLAVQKQNRFSTICEDFFYDPKTLMSDTSYGSSYFIQDVANSYFVYEFLAKKGEMKRYWNDDIKDSHFVYELDTLCDCNLLVESVNNSSFHFDVCFYKNKIYSFNMNGWNR